MKYDVHIEHAAGHPLAVVRRRASLGELSKVVPEACGFVWNTLKAQKVTGAGRNVSVYMDDVINLEVGVEVDRPFAGHGEVVGSMIPAGTVATATHVGPYNQLAEAHRTIRAWCKDHGHTPAGPNWEIYGHWLPAWNNDPTKIRTDVFYLVNTDGGAVR